MTEIALNGYRAYVEEFGDGAPVVLVHGLGGTGTDIWKHQIADLAREFTVVAYDLRGSGQSETTPGPYTIDLLVDDLRALVEKLALDGVALVGHSMGGSIVLAYASRYPDGVRAVVGVGAPAELPDAARRAWPTGRRRSRRRAWERWPRRLPRTASPPPSASRTRRSSRS